jgi:hypothetical protein
MAFSRSFLVLITACAWMGFGASPLQAFTVPGTPIVAGRRSALNLRPSVSVGKGLPVAPMASRRSFGPVMAGNKMVDLTGKVIREKIIGLRMRCNVESRYWCRYHLNLNDGKRSNLSGDYSVQRDADEMNAVVQVAFVAGVADASGYGWAIAKQLANAGATIIVGTWPPVLSLFERGLSKGFGEDSKLLDGTDLKIAKVS